MKVTFWVSGLPAPQGSKRHVGHGVMVESSKRCPQWRAVVTHAAGIERRNLPRTLDGPIRLDVEFHMPRPKRPKALRPDRMPDLSKLIRSTEDAITDADLWADDARVVDVTASKNYATDVQPTGAHITITEIEETA